MDNEQYIDHLVEISESIAHNKVTILTGRNAGGKSLIRRLLHSSIGEKIGKTKVVIPHASQELRTSSNPSMGALSSMAHDLQWLATSSSTIDTIKKVLNYKNADYIVIDEPEIGMGEELQLGMADWLNEKIAEHPCKGILIITHSRTIVKNIKFDNFINLEGKSVDEWVNRDAEKISVEDFLKFSNDLFISIRDRINKNKDK